MTSSWNDTQTDLIQLVTDVCQSHLDWTPYLGQDHPGAVDHSDVWKLLTNDVGLRGLTLPESVGGHGESWKTVGAVVYALAGYVAAVPVLDQFVAVEALLAGLDEHEFTAAYLSGQAVPSVAVPADMPSHDFFATVSLDGDRITGTLSGVPAPGNATDFLILAEEQGRLQIVRTAVGAASVTAVPGIDVSRPLADVVLSSAPAVVLGSGIDAGSLWGSTLGIVEAMVAVEQAGTAATLLSDSVQYSTQRVQFGRAICVNQAVRHQLADMWISVQEAQAITMYALDCLTDGDPDLPVAICMARSFCADVARRAAETATQIHGGMGFSWETGLHLGLKRALADGLWLAPPTSYRRRLRVLVDL